MGWVVLGMYESRLKEQRIELLVNVPACAALAGSLSLLYMRLYRAASS